MTRDEVIALADAALHTPVMEGELLRFAALIETHLIKQGYRQCAKGQRTTQFCVMLEEAVQAEREACAKVVEETDLVDYEHCMVLHTDGHATLKNAAAAIRSRT